MKSNIFMRIVSISFLVFSCSQAPKYNSESVLLEKVDEDNTYNSVQDATAEKKTDLLHNLKIIKNADCRFKVANVDSVTQLSQNVISKYNGYISDMRLQNTTHSLENRFTARMPQHHFEAVLAELSTFAEFVDYKNITSTDVSEEYVDLQTRLKTKLIVKERYEKILRVNAKTVEEILLAEEKLRVLQEEIEAAQGRLNYLGNKVAFSTIQIDLYETVYHTEEPLVYKQSYVSKIKDSLSFGWELIKGTLLALLYIWPLFIIGISLFVIIKYWRKKK